VKKLTVSINVKDQEGYVIIKGEKYGNPVGVDYYPPDE